jgi:hypothetical protein
MGLEPAPDIPVTDTGVEFGTYRGSCASTDLAFASRIGRFTRIRHEKRWQWFCAGDDTLALGGMIIDAGPAGIGSLWVFDREESEMLVDTSRMIPPFMVHITDNPTAATTATGRSLGSRLAIGWRGDRAHVSGHISESKFTLGYDTTVAEPVTAICPVDTGSPESINITQKSACLPVSGVINIDGRCHRLNEAVGMLDYSHGLLGRESTWRWAIASGHACDGTPVGFNVVRGFNDGLENVIWEDGSPRSIGRANIEFDVMGSSDWRITTEDGELSVTFDIEGTHSKDIDLGLIERQYHQPFGCWEGTIGSREVEGIYGSAGINQVKW